MPTRRHFIAASAAAAITASAPTVAFGRGSSSGQVRDESGRQDPAADDELTRYNTLIALAQSVPSPER